jgi:hypothetical protein
VRAAAVTVLAIGMVLGLAGTASAHTALTSTDPAADGTVTGPLVAVTLTFSARVLGGEVTVSGPDGTPVGSGEVQHDGAVLTAPVTLTAAGRHTVTWSAVADDGHELDGTFAFEHAPATPPPATAAPTPPAPTSPAATTAAPTTVGTDRATPTPGTDTASASSGAGGLPGWVLPVAAAAVLVAGGLTALRLRRR